MKSRAKGTRNNWALDGETITMFIPMTWKRRGGRKVIIAADGSDARAPAKARPDETLIRALAQWWARLSRGRSRLLLSLSQEKDLSTSPMIPPARGLTNEPISAYERLASTGL